VIGNKLELDILGVFREDYTLPRSINQIAGLLKKAYPYIHTKVSELISEGVLNKVVIGRSYLCYPNLKSQKAVCLLSLLELAKLEQPDPERELSALKDSVSGIKSDSGILSVVAIDSALLAIVVNPSKKEEIKEVMGRVTGYGLQIVGCDEFKLLCRQGLRKRTVLYGLDKFFELLSEAGAVPLLANES